jgi:hypothetical protein
MKEISASQAALLLRLALERKRESQDERNVRFSRARLTRLTLKRLWKKKELKSSFLDEVAAELLKQGWIFFGADDFYAVVQIRMVRNWTKVSSKVVAGELERFSKGSLDFKKLERKLEVVEEDNNDDD